MWRGCERGFWRRVYGVYNRALRALVYALAGLAGASVLAMMLTTCADVFMRAVGRPLTGSYDVVRVLSVLVIACALPYTTAVKGHVAVELVFQKLSPAGRVVLDSLIRVLVILLFGFMAVQNVNYAQRLRASGEVMLTLQMPVFWIPGVIALACGVVVLVVLHNLLHPGKAMIHP